MKIIIAPDSFKEPSASAVADAIERVCAERCLMRNM